VAAIDFTPASLHIDIQFPHHINQGVAMKTENLLARITVESGKCGGRPCIRGMRIRVLDVLEMLASGMEIAEILEDYPYLEREDITAVLLYSARQFDHPVLLAA